MARTSLSQCNLNAEPKRADRQLQFLSGVPKYRLLTFRLATFLAWTRGDSKAEPAPWGSLADVRFGSKADIGQCRADVCFTPKADMDHFAQHHAEDQLAHPRIHSHLFESLGNDDGARNRDN